MDKEKAIALWQDYLTGDIEEADETLLHEFLEANSDIAIELKDLEQTWLMFDEIERPEPSEQMDARFHGMMAAYRSVKRQPSRNFLDVLVELFASGWQVGLASLFIGVLVGWWVLPSQNQTDDIRQLSSEIQDMTKMMMLTLIEQPKAQERIRAVNLVSELISTDEAVIDALILALNSDTNVNVRLAALESLLSYGDIPEVRKELIQSIQSQESPLMQVSIADALVSIQAKNSVETLEKLKETIENDLVKDKLEESIKNLKSI